ncbi:glycerol-3-phosphate responsive antiterminator [Clostridium sp. JNZ X4-2]|uniref:Glycerol-3-phosphate responsive antiterminator n=1 Tax=Clostridium moutaii TaxID=3240932 RepID=A0ABV4BMK4_9CLOT
MLRLKEELIENPIVAAIRNNEDLEKAVLSRAAIVFVLYGDILNISHICDILRKNSKFIFIHVDLIEGLRGDAAGIKYIKEYARPDGIISTKSSNIKYANQLDLYTIQRVFILDSLSLKTGIKNIHETNPDAVEVLPGIASKIISVFEKAIKVPIIAGGLIKEKKDVMDSLSTGAIAISTTTHKLWDL